jgi:hypothetical protein
MNKKRGGNKMLEKDDLEKLKKGVQQMRKLLLLIIRTDNLLYDTGAEKENLEDYAYLLGQLTAMVERLEREQGKELCDRNSL